MGRLQICLERTGAEKLKVEAGCGNERVLNQHNLRKYSDEDQKRVCRCALGAATAFAGMLPIAGCKALGESGEEVCANEDLVLKNCQ